MIGGGPAGATAAKIAAESNAKVLLLEAAEEGRYKCCAGGIPIRNEEFTSIPHGVGDREITGGVLFTPKSGPMEFEASGKNNKGFCMFRTDFDKYLVNIAQDAGAQIKYRFRVKKIEINKSSGVKVIGSEDYQSKCVILATGLGGAQLQRQIGLEVPPMISGIQAEFKAPESVIDEQFGNRVWEFFDRKLINHGIAWVFPKSQALSIGVLGNGVKMSDFNAFLQNPFIKEKIEGREMKIFAGRKVWAAPIPDRMITKPYRERVMVIGDACGTADPILYEGIYQARLSGKIAAEVFCQALEEEDFGESELARYNALLLKHLYEEDLRYSYKFHHLLYHSGLLERVIEASYSMAQDDPEMMQSTIALFTGSETRKHSWEVMMSRKWKLVKLLGIKNSMKLLPTLLHALRI
ncbi:MAG TPA: NAD(P)/FAD-dependent oxidoreductase [Candidatus Nanopelagicaceae bacterium]|nr:NAD(P)/FAD-dependent oxidoreductase [Candidatus Nanopelagicaceae bacterium]